jgi:hypothetical protein
LGRILIEAGLLCDVQRVSCLRSPGPISVASLASGGHSAAAWRRSSSVASQRSNCSRSSCPRDAAKAWWDRILGSVVRFHAKPLCARRLRRLGRY